MAEITYHEKFILYLESLHKFNKEKIDELVEVAEERLPTLLLLNGMQQDGDIYANLTISFWNKVSTKDLTSDTDTIEEREHAGKIMEALKYFKGFVKFNRTADYKKLFAAKLKREQNNTPKEDSKEHDFPDLNADPQTDYDSTPEGTAFQYRTTHYERNPEDRQKALDKYGYKCQVCGMDFEETYGEVGRGFIEVHHMYPVCNMGENYVFDPLDEEKGLIPLCSNCHSMIHRGGRVEERNGVRKMIPMTLAELKEVYNKKSNN